MKDMNRMLRLAILMILVCCSGAAFAQNAGIAGTLKDEKGNPVVSASVVVTEGGIMKGQTITDFDGEYTIKPLSGGRYDVKFSYQNNETVVTGVSVAADQTVTVNGRLSTTKPLTGVTVRSVKSYVKP